MLCKIVVFYSPSEVEKEIALVNYFIVVKGKFKITVLTFLVYVSKNYIDISYDEEFVKY